MGAKVLQELLKMVSFSMKTGQRSLQNICAHLSCDLLTVVLGEGFHTVDDWVDWVKFLFINLTLASSPEMEIQRIQIRAGRWPGLISSPADASTFKYVVQESLSFIRPVSWSLILHSPKSWTIGYLMQ